MTEKLDFNMVDESSIKPHIEHALIHFRDAAMQQFLLGCKSNEMTEIDFQSLQLNKPLTKQLRIL